MENKSFNTQLNGVSEGPNGEKVYKFIASTSNLNRNGWIVNQEGWELDNYMNNPIIGYQHNVYGDMCFAPDPDDVIGKATAVYTEGENLIIELVFDEENEKAAKVASKLDRGYLTSGSVGFIVQASHYGNEEAGEDPAAEYIDKPELVEFSIVNIPADPDARKQSFRSNTYDAIKYIYNAFGGKTSFTEIEDMKVGDVLAKLNGATKEINNENTEEPVDKAEETDETQETEGNTLETPEITEETEETTDNSIDIEREREEETLTLLELT